MLKGIEMSIIDYILIIISFCICYSFKIVLDIVFVQAVKIKNEERKIKKHDKYLDKFNKQHLGYTDYGEQN